MEEVIQDFVTLKKSGSNYKGLSPFSNEKTPSFVVSPAKQIWKDFSSGKGGNVVSFLMELEHYTYPEALRFLAKRYGIDIKEKEITPEQKEKQTEKEAIYIIYEKVQKEFKKNLNTDIGKSIALSYFRNRGFTNEIIEKFGLGYSLNNSNSITKKLLKQGYKKELLELSGISITKGDKIYDRFRERVTFPIHSFSGRVIAFGARTLSNSKKEAKYINSPETPIYNKSKVLYGISQAKSEISRLDNCFLLEGYTDVISFYQSGIKNSVASSGTALTQEQCRLIKRFTNNVTIVYDGDEAGIKASIRGISLLLSEELNVSALTLPEGDDPDTLAKKLSKEELENYTSEKTTDFISFIVNIYKNDIEKSPIKKAQLSKQLLDIIANVKNDIDKEIYIQKISTLLNISEKNLNIQSNIISQKIANQNKRRGQNIKIEVNKEKIDLSHKPKTYNLELSTLNILLNYGKEKIGDETVYNFILREIEKDEISFFDKVNKKILHIIFEYYRKGEELKIDYFFKNEDSEILNRVTNLSFKEEKIDNWKSKEIEVPNPLKSKDQEAVDIIRRLRLNKIEQIISNELESLQIIEDEKEKIQKIELIKKLISIKIDISKKLNINS